MYCFYQLNTEMFTKHFLQIRGDGDRYLKSVKAEYFPPGTCMGYHGIK